MKSEQPMAYIHAQSSGTNDSNNALLRTFGDMFVINLAHRVDRRQEFAAQLAQLDLDLAHDGIHLFPAIKPQEADPFPSIGAKGCFYSHLEILRYALEQGMDRVLICEDDLDFVPKLADRLTVIETALDGTQWDMIYGFSPDHIVKTANAGPDGFLHVPSNVGITCSHFIAFRKSAIEKLVPYLTAISQRPAGDPAGGPMHVDGAYNWFRKEHPELRVFSAYPDLGVQRSSQSDIAAPGLKDRLPILRIPLRFLRKVRNTIRMWVR